VIPQAVKKVKKKSIPVTRDPKEVAEESVLK
jgi:hypothetical protein